VRKRALGLRWGWTVAASALLLVGLWAFPHEAARSQDKTAPDTTKSQTVLGPGLYVFQTRTRDASCGDSEPDGYVLSYFAAIHGIPHAVAMSMELTNTPHFKNWTLKILDNKQVVGDSRIGTAADAPDTHFEVKLEGDRFKGTGFRTYNGTVDGKKVRCRVNYDALLRRLD
jgi:hypothetical protein